MALYIFPAVLALYLYHLTSKVRGENVMLSASDRASVLNKAARNAWIGWFMVTLPIFLITTVTYLVDIRGKVILATSLIAVSGMSLLLGLIIIVISVAKIIRR